MGQAKSVRTQPLLGGLILLVVLLLLLLVVVLLLVLLVLLVLLLLLLMLLLLLVVLVLPGLHGHLLAVVLLLVSQPDLLKRPEVVFEDVGHVLATQGVLVGRESQVDGHLHPLALRLHSQRPTAPADACVEADEIDWLGSHMGGALQRSAALLHEFLQVPHERGRISEALSGSHRALALHLAGIGPGHQGEIRLGMHLH